MPVDVMRETLRRLRPASPAAPDLRTGRSAGPRLPARVPDRARRMRHHCIDTIVSRAGALDDTAARLYRITLANYFAAAVMMPYQAFHAAAEALGYDVHVLAQRFNAGFEQVCHRLTTLQRPNARGVPFFMLRVDNAGNVSKRFSSGTFPFSKFGGTCPLWNVHSTFDTPDRLLKQIIELPDGSAISRSRRWCAGRSRRIRSRSRALPSGWAAKSATRRGWSTPPAWIWRRPRARRSASTAGSANAKTAASAPSRR